LETKITPGSDQCEEVRIEIQSPKEGCKSSWITMNRYVHPQESCGLFVEHDDGTAIRIDTERDPEQTSYGYQVLYVQKLQTELLNASGKGE